MASRFLMWMLVCILTSTRDSILAAATQTCYYPNGDIATDDSPCSNSVGICCPLNWECMDNGLCYLENEDYYERHTCTDRSWPSTSCPRICTHNMQAPGNEAILWCNHEDWCCDGNRSWNCCTRSDTDYFNLPDPHSFAFISVTPSVASSPAATSQTGSGPITPDAPSSSSSISPVPTPTSSSVVTSDSAFTSTMTGANGVPSIVTQTLTPTAILSTSPANKNKGDPKFGLTIGLAVGIPLLIGICGIIAFYSFRHRRKAKKESTWPRAESPPMQANYQNIAAGSHAPELEGYPVAAKRSKSGRYSELYGSEGNIQSPTLSTGTNATSPPQYSPGNNGGGMTQIPEEPQELWGGYVPYRPPVTTEPLEQNDASGPPQNRHSL